MCLAVPGQILSIRDEDASVRAGQVRFGGITKEVNLVLVPEAQVDDYVVVHAGFAISILDEAEAQQVFEYVRQMDAEARAIEEPR